MKCSKCDSMRTRVIDSRVTEKGYTIRRRRVCESCSFRFTTYEYVFAKKIIIKKNGVRQEYDRIKYHNYLLDHVFLMTIFQDIDGKNFVDV